MKMKTNRSKYANISSLKELEYEKQFLQYKLAKKEKRIERDWDTIYDTWSFVSIIARTISNIVDYIPVGISAVSSITNLFGGKSKHKRKR